MCVCVHIHACAHTHTHTHTLKYNIFSNATCLEIWHSSEIPLLFSIQVLFSGVLINYVALLWVEGDQPCIK